MHPVEREILGAIEGGEFDDLPGRGEPLQLNGSPEISPRWNPAFHVLKNAGLAPAWLERQKDLRAEIERARRNLQLTLAKKAGAEQEMEIERFRKESRRLNRAIAMSNLEAPGLAFHLMPLIIESEIIAARTAAETKDRPHGRS